GLEVAVVAAFEQDLHGARARRLDLPPAHDANRHSGSVRRKEFLINLGEGCVRMLLLVGEHGLARAIVELEKITAAFRAELALAAIEKCRPLDLVESITRVGRNVDLQSVSL